MNFKTIIAACLLVAGMATSSSAATMGTIPDGAVNEGLEEIYGAGTISRTGYYGANLQANFDTELLIEYLGSEAGFDNSFYFAGVELFSTGGNTNTFDNTGIASTTVNVTAGLLDFLFRSPLGDAVNGSNPDDAGGAASLPNFFVSFQVATATSGNSLILWFDDDGAGDDDNHDDMVIRITALNGEISLVPLPAAGFLLLGGLGGLAALKRRKKA